MRKRFAFPVEIFESAVVCTDPQVAVGGGRDGCHIVGDDAVRHCVVVLIHPERVFLVVVSIQPAPLRRNPDDGFDRVGIDAVQFICTDAIRMFVVIDKTCSVKFVKPLFACEPHESILVLGDVHNIIAG
jgi:hypothetical protein